MLVPIYDTFSRVLSWPGVLQLKANHCVLQLFTNTMFLLLLDRQILGSLLTKMDCGILVVCALERKTEVWGGRFRLFLSTNAVIRKSLN